jgi:hypothetical protein
MFGRIANRFLATSIILECPLLAELGRAGQHIRLSSWKNHGLSRRAGMTRCRRSLADGFKNRRGVAAILELSRPGCPRLYGTQFCFNASIQLWYFSASAWIGAGNMAIITARPWAACAALCWGLGALLAASPCAAQPAQETSRAALVRYLDAQAAASLAARRVERRVPGP